MGVEIERKYLIDPQKLPLQDASLGVLLEQFYLARDPWVRVRIAPREAWLTIKGRGNLTRAEFEYPIPIEDAQAMRPLGVGRLVKRRFTFPYEGHVWEIDQFLEPFADFWLAEIELESADEGFSLPPWVTEEVTHDNRYSNAKLAIHGPPGRLQGTGAPGTCPDCGGDLGGDHLGRLEDHKPGCPSFPL